MLKKYPSFRIDVYPTHRTAKYPKYVADNTLKNASSCQLAPNLLQLAGTCFGRRVPSRCPRTARK